MKPINYLPQKAAIYNSLTLEEKAEFLHEAYNVENMSFGRIGKLCNKHPNTIRRDAIKAGIEPKTRAVAQSMAIEAGIHKHPTRGRQRTPEEKIKISEGVANVWENMSEEELEARKELGRERWAAMSDKEKEDFQAKAGEAIRKAAKEGSKLEKFLYQELVQHNYNVRFHTTKFVKNEHLHLDLFLPILNVVIEVDGPSHFLPIWGEDALQKSRRADADKDGLLLSMGYCVIRVQQTKSMSDKYKRDLSAELIETLEKIKRKFPDRQNRHITIGGNNG